MKKYIYTILFALLFTLTAISQNVTITGKIYDSQSNTSLPGANVFLINSADTSIKYITISNAAGVFSYTGIAEGKYKLRIIFMGYKKELVNVTADKTFVDIGIIKIQPSPVVLKNVNVEEKYIRAEQIGDTTQYNANAFKTKHDATAEELVTKMPGITLDNGTVKVQNENVKQVLVDGKPYFGEDPSIALKSMPAEVIEKIQVFDKLSDQAQFTGFDDGQSSKTLNIITKTGNNNGQFGKVYGGYGTDDRDIAGGYVNYFKSNRRLSLIGMTNNINLQNFSSQDLLGIQGSSGHTGRNFMGGMPRGGSGGNSGSYQGGGSDNFLVNQQGGITTTNAIGANYSDTWGRKINISSSYFFNNSDNNNDSKLTRNYILNPDTNQVYNENNNSDGKNFNHRLNIRFEYNIDSMNSVIITPKLYFQENNSRNLANGNYFSAEQLLSNSYNNYSSGDSGYTLNNNILYRHKFFKKGRTISFNIETDGNDKSGSGTLGSGSTSLSPDTISSVTDQRSKTSSRGYTLGSNIAYTEPIGDNSQLQLNYSPSFTKNISDTKLFDENTLTNEYDILDTNLSNDYNSNYAAHKGGVSYRYHNNKLNLGAGISYQYSELKGDQTFPVNGTVNRYFSNILPNAMLRYRFSQTSNLRINYRTSTSIPGISQLQNVVDNSDPMMLTSGNPDLKQQYVNTLFCNYGSTNLSKGKTMFIFLFASYTDNYIGNSVIHAFNDTTIDNIHLYQGAQYSKPVNLDKSISLRSFFTYSFPLNFIKCNLNLLTGFQYGNIPGLINNIKNISQTYNISQGIVLSSNISEKTDFTVSYTPNYSIVQNSIQKENNNNYFSQTTTAKLNWIFWKGFFITTDATHYLYSGLTQKYNQDFFLLNPGIGKKMFKNKNGEIKITAFDILKQNKSILRTVTESYIEDSQTQLLQRYFMITFTYNIKKFKVYNNIDNGNKNNQH